MISDHETNTVCISHYLSEHLPSSDKLVGALNDHNIKITPLQTPNIWARDYMPIQVGPGRFVKFLHPQYWSYVPPAIYRQLYPTQSDIMLDGGNVVRQGDIAIITDIVFRHNFAWERDHLLRTLEKYLEARIVIIPKEPDDDMGHADGIVKWVPGTNKVLLSNFASRKDGYFEEVSGALVDAGIDYELFPLACDQCPELCEKDFRLQYPLADDYSPGVGYYVNYLHVQNLILYPVFGFPEDEECAKLLEKLFPDTDRRPIDCYSLGMEGGLLHCVTAQYAAL